MQLSPLHDRVLIRRTEEATKTTGGIILPSSASEKPSSGVVVAVGPGRRLEGGGLVPIAVECGDHVYFGRYSGSNVIEYGGESLVVMSEAELLAVIKFGCGGE